MPAKVVKRGNKYRVVDADSEQVVHTASGSAADGGGHSSEEAAKRQARAINASLQRRGKI
jgi:hypothetical protein